MCTKWILSYILSLLLTLQLLFALDSSNYTINHNNLLSKPQIELDLKWPVHPKSKHSKVNITSTFGESRSDHFHNGLDIGGHNLPIHPVADGTIVYIYNLKRDSFGKILFGGGNTIIVKHQNTYSGYMHLDTISPEIQENPNQPITTQSIIAHSGNTGHSANSHLHFFVFDKPMTTLYNPLHFLDNTFYNDHKPPSELRYYVKLSDEELVHIQPYSTINLSKNFPFYMKLYDSGIHLEKWGIYHISISHKVSDAPYFQVTFDYLKLKNDAWHTSNSLLFSDVYYKNLYYIGDYFRNNSHISWIASGYKGPSQKKQYKFQIINQ